eukprot:3986311-Amphidinium_carterae.2
MFIFIIAVCGVPNDIDGHGKSPLLVVCQKCLFVVPYAGSTREDLFASELRVQVSRGGEDYTVEEEKTHASKACTDEELQANIQTAKAQGWLSNSSICKSKSAS